MFLGEPQESSPFPSVSNCVHEILQCALFNIGDGIFHKSLMKNKFDKRGFKTFISKLAEAFQNTSDP